MAGKEHRYRCSIAWTGNTGAGTESYKSYGRDHTINAGAKAEIAGSQGLLFVTPEYNRSMPGVLKNAIDQASRPYGHNAWAGKPAGVIGISVGQLGTAMSQQHLRNVLAYLDVPTLGQPEVFVQAKPDLFTAAGDLGESIKPFLQGWMDRYVAWVTRHGT